MLPAIIITHDVYMLKLEQDHQEEAGVQESYKMYENATRCTKTLRDVREWYKIYEMYEDEEIRDKWKVSESVWF